VSAETDDDIRSVVQAAVPEAGPVPMGAIRERAARRRARHHAVRVVGLVLLVVTAAVLLPLLARSDVEFADPRADASRTLVPLPPPGAVAPEFLGDGTPVFVAHEEDGDVFVVEARSPSYPDVEVLVGYCPATGWLEEPFRGSRFDVAGHWHGGPAPRGLTPREHDVVGDEVHVLGRRPAPERGAPSQAKRPVEGELCGDEEMRDPRPPGTHLVAHLLARLDEAVPPEALRRQGSDEPQLVLATIERVGDEPVRVCANVPEGATSPAVCDEESLRLAPTTFDWFRSDDEVEPGRVLGIHGAFLMTARDGRVQLHTVLPGLFEYGGWAEGAEPVEREGRLRRWESVPAGVGVEGGREEPPPLVLLLDDGRALAVYPREDVDVFGGPVLVGIDGEGFPSTYERLLEVLAMREHDEVVFRVRFNGTSGDAVSIRELDRS
jgi:hypothetical protein